MGTLKLAALFALSICILAASTSFAAPACCDPNNSASSGGSFLPGPSVNRPVQAAQPSMVAPSMNQPPVAGGCCGANRPGGCQGCAATGKKCCPGPGAVNPGPGGEAPAAGPILPGQVYRTPTVVPIGRIVGPPAKTPGIVRPLVPMDDQRSGKRPRSVVSDMPVQEGSGLW